MNKYIQRAEEKREVSELRKKKEDVTLKRRNTRDAVRISELLIFRLLLENSQIS